MLRHPDEKDTLKMFVDQLCECAEEHFLHEEKLQLKFMFPYLEENKIAHQQLIADLELIKNIVYRFVESPAITPEEVIETGNKVNQLMRNWFIEHIIKCDMKMKGLMDNAII